MSVALYLDEHVHRAITAGLRLRGVNALTAQEDGRRNVPDDALLDRATELQRVLFSQDEDLLAKRPDVRETEFDLPAWFMRISYVSPSVFVSMIWN